MKNTNEGQIDVIYRVSPPVTNEQLNSLFVEVWEGHTPTDFRPVLERSLSFICAYYSAQLIGFVNIAWDGGVHAFILDTTVHREFQRRGIGLHLLEQAKTVAREHNVEWLHVDFEPHLQEFYNKCGFKKTDAGLIYLSGDVSSW